MAGYSLFSQVLSAFKARLSPGDIESFQFTNFDELKGAIDEIQRAQAQRRGLRNLNKIRPFLNGLEQYSKVIEVFVNAKPDIMAFIWGPIKLCLQIASKLTEAFDALLDAYERIGSTLFIFSMIERSFLSYSYVQQVLVDIYEDILDFHKRAILFFKQSAWRIGFRITVHTFGDMFGDVIKKLERSKELLLQSTSLAHFQEAQNNRLLLSKELEEQSDRMKKDRKLTVVEWLSPVFCRDNHEELQRKRQEYPHTTRWITREPSLRRWIRPDKTTNQVFWVHGIPGAGKTFLFSSVIDFIRDTVPAPQVIYFYCKNGDPFKGTFDGLARSLIAQILQLNPVALDFLYETAVKSGERHPSTFSMYQDILRTLLTSYDLLYLGIDGLDECEKEDRQNILMLLKEICKIEGNIKLFITSQRFRDIERSLDAAFQLEIKCRHLKNDIHNYVSIRSCQLCEKHELGDERRGIIVKDICNRSEGMFLLARLILDNLVDQDNLEDLEEELRNDKLPRGIDEAYGRILLRLSKGSSDRSRARIVRVLELLITARYPLKVSEVQGALSINAEDMSVDFRRRRILIPFNELCGPIVEVHADDTLTLVHPTAKQYLLQYHSPPFIDFFGSNLRMATLCVKYLTMECFSDLHNPENHELVAAGNFAFQQYATLNWIHHAETVFNLDIVRDVKNLNSLEDFCRLLLSHHGEISSTHLETLKSSPAKQNKWDLKSGLSRVKDAYEAVFSIEYEKVSDDSIPYSFQKLRQVRSVLEMLAASRTKAAAIFQEAYGTKIFKCPILSCFGFLEGFTSQEMRDKHETTHQGQQLSCTHDGCDYSIIGFSSMKQLVKHMAEHETPPKEVQFPRVKQCSLRTSLEYAIDKDDDLAVRALLSEFSALQFYETDFLGRALRQRSCKAIKILLWKFRLENYESFINLEIAQVIELAVDNDDVEMASLAINTSPRILLEREFLDSLLKTAVVHGNAKMMAIFFRNQFQHKRDLSWTKDRDHFIAAATNGHDEVLNLLIDIYGTAPQLMVYLYKLMIHAASKGHDSTVRLLLKKSLELNADSFYPSYLQELAPDVEKMLAKLMTQVVVTDAAVIAAVDAPVDVWGDVAVDVAVNATVNAAVNAALDAGDFDKLVRLLHVGMRYRSEFNRVLVLAASQGNCSVVSLLFNSGFDVNSTTAQFALREAVNRGHEAVAKLFLRNPRFKVMNNEVLDFIPHSSN